LKKNEANRKNCNQILVHWAARTWHASSSNCCSSWDNSSHRAGSSH